MATSQPTPNRDDNPLRTFSDALKEMSLFVDHHANGVSALRSVSEIIDGTGWPGHHSAEAEAGFTHLLDAATAILEDGSGYLYEVLTLRLWSAFEGFVNDTCLHRLGNGWWRTAEITRDVKAEIAVFAALSERQQREFFLNAIKQKIGRKKGAFAALKQLLDEFDLKPKVPQFLTRELIALGDIYQCFAHRHGIVDERLVEACPWMRVTIGERLVLERLDLAIAEKAVLAFGMSVGRMTRVQGMTFISEEQDHTIATIVEDATSVVEQLRQQTSAQRAPEPAGIAPQAFADRAAAAPAQPRDVQRFSAE